MSVRAQADPLLAARILRCTAMRYRGGADRVTDRPAHVRAASGLIQLGERLAVVQDDASFVALVDPGSGLADAIALPRGPGGWRHFDDRRGNKDDKLDLEAVTTVPGLDGPVVLAVGSGSRPMREHVALVRGIAGGSATVELLHVPGLFAALRGAQQFAGSEMNIEGMLHLGDRLRLFGRGNGAAREGLLPVDASCDLEWAALERYFEHVRSDPSATPPPPTSIVRYELGEIRGRRLSFTDAVLASPATDGTEHVLFTATAEASPDAVRDGPVTGSVIGIIEAGSRARWAELTDASGRPWVAKVEGIALIPGTRRALVVVDRDEPERPAELCEVELSGPWFPG